MRASLREQLGVSVFDSSLKYIEYSILMYHAFAQSTVFTNDPFYESFLHEFSAVHTGIQNVIANPLAHLDTVLVCGIVRKAAG